MYCIKLVTQLVQCIKYSTDRINPTVRCGLLCSVATISLLLDWLLFVIGLHVNASKKKI